MAVSVFSVHTVQSLSDTACECECVSDAKETVDGIVDGIATIAAKTSGWR